MIHRLREAILWTGAVLGLLSVVAGTAVMFFGFSFLIFRSGSMGPDIPTGSLALARTTPATELESGDVVSVLTSTGARVTHRLVSSTVRGEQASLILQGDANATPDEEIYQVTEAEVEIASVPYLGYAVTVLLSPAGLLAAGCLGAMMLLVGFGSSGDRDRSGGGATGSGGGRHRRARTRDTRRSLAGAGVAVSLVAAATVAGVGVSGTLASFTDRSTLAVGTLTSAGVPAPTLTCVENTGASVTISFPVLPTPYPVTYSARLDNGATLQVTGTGNSRSITVTSTQAPSGAGIFGGFTDYVVSVVTSMSAGPWSSTATSNIRTTRAFLGGTDTTCR